MPFNYDIPAWGYGLIAVLLGTMALGAKSAAPWVPTKGRDRRATAHAVTLPPGATVMDLGCGDGSMLFALADVHPGITCIGYEIAVLPLLIGWARKLVGGSTYRNVHLKLRDFWAADIAQADAVFLFLMPEAYAKIIPKLRAELKPGAQVISECWPLPGITHIWNIGGTGGMVKMYGYKKESLG